MAEEEKALITLLELGRQTKVINIEGQDITIKRLSFGEEQNIANHVGEMEQRGVPTETTQREYAKQVVVTGVVKPKIDELAVDQIPFPTVTKIASEILDFSSGAGKKS